MDLVANLLLSVAVTVTMRHAAIGKLGVLSPGRGTKLGLAILAGARP